MLRPSKMTFRVNFTNPLAQMHRHMTFGTKGAIQFTKKIMPGFYIVMLYVSGSQRWNHHGPP